MDMVYLERRILASAGTFVGVAAVLLFFLFPTTRVERDVSPIPVAPGTIICFGETEFVAFHPFWNLGSLSPDPLGLCLEAGIALALGACVWFLYPAFRPPPV